jgi:hypothetical protein
MNSLSAAFSFSIATTTTVELSPSLHAIPFQSTSFQHEFSAINPQGLSLPSHTTNDGTQCNIELGVAKKTTGSISDSTEHVTKRAKRSMSSSEKSLARDENNVFDVLGEQ